MIDKKYILAFDQGTTSSRCILFDRDGSICEVAQKEFTQIFPKDGWVEHNPKEIWATQFGMMTEVLAKSNVLPSEIDSLGITNQRETTIIWDKKTSQPINNAIVWQDRRTASICEGIKAKGLDKTILEKTGLVLDSYFSGTKIKWILDNVPDARSKAENGELAFGTVDTWLIWKLTNGKVHATDVSNASRTLLFNIHTGKWDDELLKILDIPKSLLPEVRNSSDDYGFINKDLIGEEIIIRGVAGDQQAATFGQACLKPGMAKNTYGTGCFLLMNVGKDSSVNQEKILKTIAWNRGSKGITYALEGSVFIGGAIIQWLRDGLAIINKSSQVEKLAKTVQDNGGLYFVPALVGLGSPHWDPYARGMMIGINRDTNQGHIARAALEGVAFQSCEVLHTMQKISSISLRELRVDGGASQNNLLMQFQADILDVPVVRPKVTETSALGAAYLAGLYTGFWKSADEISALWKLDREFIPQIKQAERERLLSRWKDALSRSKNWLH